VGIADKAYNRADTLSGGQQQRVGIARTLMQEPKLILADEPVASLDPVLAHSILQYLELLNKEGITIICSLHFLDLVHRYATRVIGLKDGVKVFEGLPAEIDRQDSKRSMGRSTGSARTRWRKGEQGRKSPSGKPNHSPLVAGLLSAVIRLRNKFMPGIVTGECRYF
jgi:phosphonate transport system ATP-binding protein